VRGVLRQAVCAPMDRRLRILKETNGSGLAFRAELLKDGAERLELART
jgi:hypothetical protein